ncbi:16S rRNA (cytidine(1402)-2'-O)-methyltransferase [Paenibacillaceae bacterium]|nr:16S rRNA (cytidine(1402)-2'-O)-methyltransferase [Paenibacillaceae bacterium]
MNVQKSFGNASSTTPEQGVLYIVGTPIGNLEDMTYRAVRTLKEVDMIAAEDTRQTRKLLTHFEIGTRLVSYHEHNKRQSGSELIRLLKTGQQIALVSDAGMPAISDPGADLVSEAIGQGISVVAIPGANAALTALVVSGLSTDKFTFAGFPPRDKGTQNEWLDQLQMQDGTLLFYESPHRVVKTLTAMLEVWGNRKAVMARELTKRHEEIFRGTIEECLQWLAEHPPLGEYCLAVEGAAAGAERSGESLWWSKMDLESHVAHYEDMLGDRKSAMKRAAQDRGISKRDVYHAIMKKSE